MKLRELLDAGIDPDTELVFHLPTSMDEQGNTELVVDFEWYMPLGNQPIRRKDDPKMCRISVPQIVQFYPKSLGIQAVDNLFFRTNKLSDRMTVKLKREKHP